MNIRSKILFLAIYLSTFYVWAQTDQPKYSYEDLDPKATQNKVEQFVTQFLNNYHYQKFSIDDSLSSKVFEDNHHYMESLNSEFLAKYYAFIFFAGQFLRHIFLHFSILCVEIMQY